MLILFLGAFFALIFFARGASAATYFVRTDGSDTNCTGLVDAAYPGSGSGQACAYVTVAKINALIYSNGDIVRFKRGQTWSGTQLTPKSNVTYAATIEEGAKPIISSVATMRAVFLSSIQGATLENLDIRGGTSAALQVNSSGNITPIILSQLEISGGTNYQVYIYESVVNASDINSIGASPFLFTTAASPIITTNANCNRCVAMNGPLTTSGFSQTNAAVVTLDDCISYNNKEDGFSANNTGSLTCNRCKAYNNGITSRASSGDGFTSHDTSTLQIYSSIAYGNFKSGAAVTGSSHGEIINNTFYNNYEATNGSGWDGTGDIGIGINSTGNWVVKNNITKNHPVEFQITATAIPANITSDYNDFNDTGGTNFDYLGTLYNWSDYLSHGSKDTHSLNQYPLFTNAVGNDFTLQHISPAINAGTDVGLTTDYAGNPKSGPQWDIGAYEFQDSTPPTTTADVDTGLYNSAQSVALTCSDGSGVGCDKIYYTTDGTDPTTSGTRTQATPPATASIPATTTLKFYSTDLNGNSETYQTKAYTIDTTAPATAASPAGGTYTSGQTVTLTCSDSASGCDKIYYTLEGSEPTTSSAQYSSPINIPSTTTLKYFARDLVGNSETVKTEIYTISPEAPEDIPTLAVGNKKTYLLSSNTTISVKSKYVVFRGRMSNLNNGRVQVYQDGKLKKQTKVNKRRKWSVRVKERSRSASHTYQFKYYDQNIQLVETTQNFTVMIDRQKPRFTYLPTRMTKAPGETVSWNVSDNDQIKYYEYKFKGRVYKTNDNSFSLADGLSKGTYRLKVQAYDRAGNSAVRRAKVIVR